MPLKQQYVSIVAILVVVATVGALWNIGAYRVSLERPATAGVSAGVSGVSSVPAGPAVGSSPTITAAPAGVTPTVTETTTVAVSDAPVSSKSAGASTSPTPLPVAKDAETATPVTTAAPTRARTPSSPATTAPPSDYDGDGIPDSVDRCPTRPETLNGFKDGDGCPDIVATSGAS